MIKNYYHICSDGNSASVLFRNEVDFKAAMNRVASIVLRMKIKVLAFVLMDNHFHFVVECEEEEQCVRFVTEFKRITGKYIAEEYQESALLRRLPVKILQIKDEDVLRTVIAYVVKNPTKARISMFYNYPWGSGGLYFREKTSNAMGVVPTAAMLGPFAVRSMCRTRVRIPESWRIENGVILPDNYVDVEAVEALYRTTRSYMFSLSLNKDDELEKDMEEWGGLMVSDNEIRPERDLIMRRLFGRDSIRSLSAPERLQLAKELKRKFKCSRKQLARLVHLPYETIEKAL